MMRSRPRFGRVRHRRSPVAVGANQDVFLEESWIPRDELSDFARIIAPDRVRELHRLDEPGPVRSVITSGESELCVGELRGCKVERFGMVFAQLGIAFASPA
jgi:hypothetical protein